MSENFVFPRAPSFRRDFFPPLPIKLTQSVIAMRCEYVFGMIPSSEAFRFLV